MVQQDLAAAQQLCTLLAKFKERRGLSFEKLAERSLCSRGTAENYITKPGHSRGEGILNSLLTALEVTDDERAEAVRLHRLTRPNTPDPATVGWSVAAAEADCTVWEMDEFTPAEATVHPAIRRGRVVANDHNDVMSPPAYVQRDHDTSLRADVAASASGELRALVVLRGGPSTGKTRSLFEAVQALGVGWAVVRPRSASALRGLVTSGLLYGRRCVLWLNELQTFLGPNGTGLSLDVLRDLFTATRHHNGGKPRSPHPIVMVGTLWAEKLRDATTSADHLSDNRDLLVNANQWVHWHDIPRDFSPHERQKAQALVASTGDARLRAALTNPDRVGFTQTLAGGHELLQHYLTAPNPMDQLLLDAAGDARRLGHTSPMSVSLLRAIATALWREERGQATPPHGWFDTAIAHATQPLRSTQGVQALIPLDDPGPDDTASEHVTYELADYLEQHLSLTRRTQPVVDAVWDALHDHSAGPEDLFNAAIFASARGRFDHGEALYRTAGTPEALAELARLLANRPGREHDAEQAYRAAVAGGHPVVLYEFLPWLEQQPDREGDIEQAYLDAIARGERPVRNLFAHWLSRQPGRVEDAERLHLDGIAEGIPAARIGFAKWLATVPGRKAEAEQAYRDAIADGDADTLIMFAQWLSHQPGREEETERVYRKAVTADGSGARPGFAGARHAFASWLARQPGRKAEAEQAYRDAIAAEDLRAAEGLAKLLSRQPGREKETEQAYRDAIAADDYDSARLFADWLSRQPGREAEAEQAYRDAAAAGGLFVQSAFADWLSRQPGREAEAEQAYRDSIVGGELLAVEAFRGWLEQQPGLEEEVEQAYRYAIAVGHPEALSSFVKWLAVQPGREHDAEQIARRGLAD
ncbi:tetratricopeptide repeat protein [Amycolatopsis japonica]|nr:helix-turn-helix domain-containing protein [Amycolatopsis japonica]